MDLVFVDNVGYGHILAEKALDQGKGDGDFFNIHNNEVHSTSQFDWQANNFPFS